MTVLFWLPAICIALHVFEEFVWPGGFLAWYRSYRPEFTASLTVRFVVLVNGVLFAFALWRGIFGAASSRGVSALLGLMAALACHGVFHGRGAIRSHRYSPGIVTGVILCIPLGVWGYGYFLTNGISLQSVIVSFAVGAAYQFWSAANHKRRFNRS